MKAIREKTDAELILAYKRGLSQAGEELINRHYPQILRFCCRRLRSNDDGKDVAQNVFFKVMVEKKIFEFRGQSQLATWLTRIAINACNSQYSRYQRRQFNFSEYEKTKRMDECIPCSCPNPEERLARNEAAARLSLLLEHLPPKYRRAICSTYLENRSYREAAQVLGIPITALGVQILRGKKMLSALLTSKRVTDLNSFKFKSLSLANAFVDAA
jgi:RNA polymerase sigma-70 factor (ECF subfamily)